ncbi:MAG: hypothetical protein DHS20C01_38030 [marine bacterium B5-7]|nr:MAG: hypothetical protein DHS20C01_38030 [marine bacterium B5-7]
MVESVILPAHAQTTGESDSQEQGCAASASRVVTLNCGDRDFTDGVNDGWSFPYRIIRDDSGCLSFENGNFDEECAIELAVVVEGGIVRAVVEMNDGSNLQSLIEVTSPTTNTCPDLTPTNSTSDSDTGMCTTGGGITISYVATVSIEAGSSNLGTASFEISEV